MTHDASRPGDATRSTPDDLLLGRLALDGKLVTPEQLAEALREQEEAQRAGREAPLGQLLLARGRISVEDLARLLREQARREGGLPRLPRYEIQERIGHGASAVVHRAWDRELRRPVAIKVQKETAGVSDLARRRFRREAQAAGALAHPNVVTIFDAGEQDGTLYLVMELVEGRSLAEILKETPRDLKGLASIVERAARGVAAAHARGIVHRDLKPANILVPPQGEPKVGDFGLAHVNDSSMELTRTGATLGTPLYMAPEQVQGRSRDIAPPTDVHALGAILYEAATGRPPFPGDALMEIYGRITCEEAVPPRRLNPAVPPDFETIVMRALEKDPLRRYADAGALAEDLRRFREGSAIQARPPGPGLLAWRWFRRHRAAAAAAAAVLLGALVLAGAAGANALARRRAIARHLEEGARARAGLERLPAERERIQQEIVGHYRSALLLDPAHEGARRALAELYFDSFERALREADRRGMEIYRDLTLFFDDGRFAPRLARTGLLAAVSEPPGAEVYLLLADGAAPPVPFSLSRGRAAAAGPECSDFNRWSVAPVASVRVPAGKYLLVFRKAGFPDARREARVEWGGSAEAKATLWDVSEARMREVFGEAKTPYKYGIVIPNAPGVDTDVPAVFRRGERWYLAYTRVELAAGTHETHLAESADLLSWKPLGPILAAAGSGWDAKSAVGTPALQDPAWGGGAGLEPHDGKYWMSYLGTDRPAREGSGSIGMAWTRDPSAAAPWTRLAGNPVLTAEQPGVRPWETLRLVKGTVVRDARSSTGFPFVMVYEGEDKGRTGRRLGMAGSRDLAAWERLGSGPAIDHGGGISGHGQLVRMGDLWVMFYFGAFWRGNKGFDTFAGSYDLVHWTPWPGPWLVEPSEPWDHLHAHKPWLVKHDGVVYHFYCAVGTQGRGIAVATSKEMRR